MGTRLIQAPTDFLTLPNPSFFRSSLIQRGTEKSWICRPDQKASPEPSKAQSKSLSRAHRQRKSAANPPLIRANPRKSAPVLQFRSFSPYPAPRQNDENCKSVRPAVPPLKFYRVNYGGGGGRGRGRFGDPSSRILAYVVCSLSFRLSVHLSVRPCFCLCACSPVVGRTACFLRLRPSGSPPSSPSIKPSEFSQFCSPEPSPRKLTRRMAMNASKSQSSHPVSRLCW